MRHQNKHEEPVADIPLEKVPPSMVDTAPRSAHVGVFLLYDGDRYHPVTLSSSSGRMK